MVTGESRVTSVNKPKSSSIVMVIMFQIKMEFAADLEDGELEVLTNDDTLHVR